MAISRQVSPSSLPVVSAGYYQVALVDESSMVIIQIVKQIDKNGCSAWDAFPIPQLSNKSNSNITTNSSSKRLLAADFPRGTTQQVTSARRNACRSLCKILVIVVPFEPRT
jgi:hypothetical protein